MATSLSELRRVLCSGGLPAITFPVNLRLETVYEDMGVVNVAGRIKHFG